MRRVLLLAVVLALAIGGGALALGAHRVERGCFPRAAWNTKRGATEHFYRLTERG